MEMTFGFEEISRHMKIRYLIDKIPGHFRSNGKGLRLLQFHRTK